MKNCILRFCKSALIYLAIVSGDINAQYPVTTDILSHTFYVRVDSFVGTGFIIGKSNLNFVVTARHIFKEKYINNDSITYYINGGGFWEGYRGKILLHENPNVDIAVIKPKNVKGWESPFKSESPPMFLGEEVIFLGFPYSIVPSRKMAHGEIHYPHPILKKGMHNGVVESDGVTLFLFEGHNNNGFSGGPIITKSWKQKPIPTYRKLVAVVKGFIPGAFELNTPRGKMIVNENSGIMIGTPISYIKEILKQNGYNNAW